MSDADARRDTQLDQQSSKIAPYHSQDSYTDVFSTMCSSLLEIVTGRKVIQDRYLLEFSRLVVQMISNAIETLPDSFHKLLAAVMQYLRDSMWNDADQSRKISYIRAHQIASILDVYCTEQKHEELMRQEWKANWQNRYLLFYIFQSPGITLSELQEKLKLPRSELNRCIGQFEDRKLLSSHRSGYDDEPYYILSRLGSDLCQNLFGLRIHSVMPNQWSQERVYLLYILLETQLKASHDTIPVMTYVRKVSVLREADVQYFVSRAKPNAKSHASTDPSAEVRAEPYRIRSAVQSLPKDLEHEAFRVFNVYEADGVDEADEAYDMVDKEEYRDERYFRRKESRAASENQMAAREASTDLRMRGRIPGYQYS